MVGLWRILPVSVPLKSARMILVNGFFLESAADNVMDGIDGNKGGFVLFEGDFLELDDLETGDDAVENLLVIAGVGALPVQIGDAASEPVHEGIGDFLVFVRDNHDGIGLVKSLENDVNHLGDDEVGDKGIHRLVPAENEACRAEDKEVEEHDDLAHGEGCLAIQDDGGNLGAVERAALPDDQSHACARDDAAEDGGEEVVLGNPRDRLKELGEDGKGDDGDDGGDGKGLANLLVAQIEKRQVQYHHVCSEWDACQIACHDGDADHAAIDDVVGHEEYLQSGTVNQRADDEDQIFLDPVHSRLAPAQNSYLVAFHTIPPFI